MRMRFERRIEEKKNKLRIRSPYELYRHIKWIFILSVSCICWIKYRYTLLIMGLCIKVNY